MIEGIVLAAGFGRRIGGPKALVRLGNETFHERVLRAFGDAGLKVIVVINPQVEEALPDRLPNERRVVNADPDQAAGMLASVRLGVAAALTAGATGAVLLPVDHPLVTGKDIKAVAQQLEAGATVVVAHCRGRRGHPIGICLEVMNEIVSDSGIATLRDVVRRDAARVVEVEVGEGALLGVNTQADLDRVSNHTFR